MTMPLVEVPKLGPVRLLEDVVTAAIVGHDQSHLAKPWVQARCITVDTDSVGVVDFGVTPERQMVLFENGYAAGQKFLQSWDWERYLHRFRGQRAAPGPATGAEEHHLVSLGS